MTEELNQLYEDAMYSHLINQGYSEFQAEVILHKLTQKVRMNDRRNNFLLAKERNDDVPLVQVNERLIDSVGIIQADDKMIDAVLKRKRFDF